MSPQRDLPRGRVHFVGIGGIHMSALAGLVLDAGGTASGSDLTLSPLPDALAEIATQLGEPAAAREAVRAGAAAAAESSGEQQRAAANDSELQRTAASSSVQQ